jgi:hypothetical protein
LDTELKEAKRSIRRFLRYYSDEKLCELLAHAQAGKLSYLSCCCLVGVLTADHPLREGGNNWTSMHYHRALAFSGGKEADRSFVALGIYGIGFIPSFAEAERIRRRRMISIVRGEMRLRERFASLPRLIAK